MWRLKDIDSRTLFDDLPSSFMVLDARSRLSARAILGGVKDADDFNRDTGDLVYDNKGQARHHKLTGRGNAYHPPR